MSSVRGKGEFVCGRCGYGAMTPKGLVVHEGGSHCDKRAARRRPSAPIGSIVAEDNDDDDDNADAKAEKDITHEDERPHKRPRNEIEVEIENGNGNKTDVGTDLARLLGGMTTLREAVAYEQRHRQLIEDIARNAKERERVAAQLRQEIIDCQLAETQALQVESDRADVLQRVAEARAVRDAAQRQLDDARAARAHLISQCDMFIDLAGPITRDVDAHVSALAAHLPADLKVCFSLDVYYTNEQGRIDASAVIARLMPTLNDDMKRAEAAIREALAGVAAATNALDGITSEQNTVLRGITTLQDTFGVHRKIVTRTERALEALVVEGKRLAALATAEYRDDEQSLTGAYGALSLPARRLVLQLRKDADLGKALCDTVDEVASYFVRS